MKTINTLTSKLVLSLDELQRILLEKGFINKDQKVIDVNVPGGNSPVKVHIQCVSIEEKEIKVTDNVAQVSQLIKGEELEKLLNTTLEDLDISVRLYNILKGAGLISVREIVNCTESTLMKLRNFGEGCLKELKEELKDKGVELKKEE
jgi:DNA-directed RNA polymerase subunit alpha